MGRKNKGLRLRLHCNYTFKSVFAETFVAESQEMPRRRIVAVGRSYEFLGTAEGIAKLPATQITPGEGIFDLSVDNSIAGWQDLKCSRHK